MATINIGNLAFTHKGDYASGTAYVKNDVVYFSTNGNAYIAKQATTGNAPTNATYWNQFAQGSGGIWNAGLSLGSASQKLRVNSSGNALEFFTEPAVTSDFVKVLDGTFSGSNLIFDNLDTSTYKTFKFNLSRIAGTTGNDPTLYTRFRYDNSGSQASISSSSYVYRVHGKYNYASAGDTGESSSTSTQTAGRWSWAISTDSGSSEKTSYAYLQCTDMGATDHFKHIECRHGGSYRNASNEYGFFLNGFVTCRNTSQAMNGLVIYGAYNWQCEYQVYGLK